MGKLNIKKIKSNLTLNDYAKIMKALDIPAFSESNDSITYWTGDKNKVAMQGSPKLIFYKQSKMFVGYTSARSYDIIALVQTRLGLLNKPCSFMDSIHFILDTVGMEIENVQRVSKPNIIDWQSGIEKFIRIRKGQAILPEYDKTILDELSHILPQPWIDEGISIDSMEKYQIGYYDLLGATTIPCFDKEGKLCGIRCRHWRKEEVDGGKYRPLLLMNNQSYKFPTNEVFYGINYNWVEIERTGRVMLVEGEKSVLKADSWFGEHSYVLGLYGSNLGLSRRNQLIKMGVKEVYIGIDSDFYTQDSLLFDKFYNKVMRLAKMFAGYCKVYVVYNNLGYDGYKYSPFDFTREQFDELWANKEVIEM